MAAALQGTMGVGAVPVTVGQELVHARGQRAQRIEQIHGPGTPVSVERPQSGGWDPEALDLTGGWGSRSLGRRAQPAVPGRGVRGGVPGF
ncbi:hypothetical protein GCM10010278_82750 [Streptomyces melanogenes]|nr:hypothetical protein GCM10010278_82750 [Streptomyces melanogenes]